MNIEIDEKIFLRPNEVAIDHGDLEALFEEIDADIDLALSNMMMDIHPMEEDLHFTAVMPPKAENTDKHLDPDVAASNLSTMQATLMDLLQVRMKPLLSYVTFLKHTRIHIMETLDLCQFLVQPLMAQLEMAMMTKPLEDLVFFNSVLSFAKGERTESGLLQMREVVCRGFQEVQKTFDLELDKASREHVLELIVLLKIMRKDPSLSEDDIARLFSIGISSVSWIQNTSIQDLSSLSGLGLEKTQRIQKALRMTDFELSPTPNKDTHAAQSQDSTASSQGEAQLDPLMPPGSPGVAASK